KAQSSRGPAADTVGLAVNRRQRRFPAGYEVLGAGPIREIVDVEALETLGEEGGHHAALARPRLGDDPGPGDLERRVLDVDLRQGLVLPGVPGRVEVRLLEQRAHRA